MSRNANAEFDERPQVLELLSRNKAGGGLVRGESCSKLLGIGLQNFQAIAEPAFLPFGRLTLLYGPNSAGKSAVSDALELWSEFRRSSDGVERVEKLSRWANFDRNDASRDKGRYVCRPEITALWVVASDVGDVMSAPYEDHGIDSPVTVFRRLIYDQPYAVRWLSRGTEPRSFDVWVGCTSLDPLIRFIRSANGDCAIRVNVTHSSAGLVTTSMHRNLETPPADNAESGPLVNGSWLEIAGRYRWNGEGDLDLAAATPMTNRKFEDEVSKFHYLVGFLVEALRQAGAACSLRIVEPIREVPNSSECIFDFRRGQSLYSQADFSSPPSYSAWQRIALDGITDGFDATRDSEKLTLYINRASEILDLEYRVDVVYCDQGRWHSSLRGVLNDVPANLMREMAERIAPSDDQRVFAQVQLLDRRGHAVQVRDVGTGVSQLIPVLEAMHFGKSVIHQPELHLHPRLQSALGDLLIEPLRGPPLWYTIVESHSEHLLLRVLRRIRETCGRGRTKEPEYTPEDVVVLYFEKNESGQSHILRLRINSHGEFLDRWPHGFFTERDEDLFAT